jgi:phage terminase small subunit
MKKSTPKKVAKTKAMPKGARTEKADVREDLFVLEYMKDFNGTRAAKAVGYSANTATAKGTELLRKISVQEKLRDALNARKERLQIDADEILRELTVLCRSDVRDFRVKTSGRLTLRPGAPDAAWRAVSSVKHRIRTVQMNNGQRQVIREVEVRLWSKTEALKLAREHLGLTREQAEKVDPQVLAHAIRQQLDAQDAKEGLGPAPTDDGTEGENDG